MPVQRRSKKSESKEEKKSRAREIVRLLQKYYPDAKCSLDSKNPFELLVATMLSAQCTDKRVNMTTPALFKKYPTVAQLATAPLDEVFSLIKSISYPNNKAKHLIGLAQKLRDQFNSEVPLDVKDLMQLPGVGRKTANVITSVIDHQPNMAVDTHVFRVAARIGLSHNAKTPLQTETQLVKNIAPELIHKAHHWLILHGRYTCTAIKPKCEQCGIQQACKYYSKTVKI